MMQSAMGRKRIRKSFGRIPEVAPMPNLIEVQMSSYAAFLQMHTRPEQRNPVGLQEVFRSVFPIKDFTERSQLEFVRYELEAPKYDVEECQQRGMTFAAPLKVTLRLMVFDVDPETGVRHVRNVKKFGVPVVVAVNTFTSDTAAEFAAVSELCVLAGEAEHRRLCCLQAVDALGPPARRVLAVRAEHELVELGRNLVVLLVGCIGVHRHLASTAGGDERAQTLGAVVRTAPALQLQLAPDTRTDDPRQHTVREPSAVDDRLPPCPGTAAHCCLAPRPFGLQSGFTNTACTTDTCRSRNAPSQ